MEQEFIDYEKMYNLSIECFYYMSRQPFLMLQTIKDCLAKIIFLDDCLNKKDFETSCEKAEKHIAKLRF